MRELAAPMDAAGPWNTRTGAFDSSGSVVWKSDSSPDSAGGGGTTTAMVARKVVSHVVAGMLTRSNNLCRRCKQHVPMLQGSSEGGADAVTRRPHHTMPEKSEVDSGTAGMKLSAQEGTAGALVKRAGSGFWLALAPS